MAIDNASKRRSAGAVGFWLFGPGVTPNASKDATWRKQSGWGYSFTAGASGLLSGTLLLLGVGS